MTDDPKTIIERFKAINAQRLDRAYSIVRASQRDFLRIMPFFFQVNHPMLPGYISRDTPAGIKGYEPEKSTLHDINKYTKSINYRKPSNCSIKAIYAMGSIGTVSHSIESDFDFWLCYDPDLTDGQVKKLGEKAQLIEQAAEKLHLEAHFFLVNAENFRSGEQLELSSESSGTAQHHLLLDEFYRTAVLIEGQFPAWWIVPPDEDHRYNEYMQEVGQKRFYFFRDIIDFGEAHAIPPEEFFGAAVWQLAKAIDSPYKSLIKLLLIESYMSEHPQMHLLSQQFKQAVYDGETDIDKLDPYRLLIERLEHYLLEREDKVRLELLHRSFYFKIDLPLSDLPPKVFEWQRVMLTEMTERWGWHKLDLILLDDRSDWKVPQVVSERQILFEALASSYRALSHFAHEIGAESMISDEDLTVLGRKLFAAYERKAGKIELIRRGIDVDLLEMRLSIHELKDEEGRSIWYLYTGYVERVNKAEEAPIKQTRALVELLAWAYFNEILSRSSSIALFSKNPSIDKIVVKRIIDRLFFQFPPNETLKRGGNNFSEKEQLEHSQFLVNTGIELADGFDMAKYETEGRGSEPLSYGFGKECLLKRLDWIQTTSWGEVLCNRYFGERGLAEAIINYFKWYSTDELKPSEIPNFMSTGITKGTSITHRLGELLTDLTEWFYGGNENKNRYVLAIGEQLFVFSRNGDALGYEAFNNVSGLTKLLKRSRPQFISTVIDQHTMTDSPLPTLFKKNKEGIIQLFFYVRRKKVDIYVLDERGTLFYQEANFYDQTTLINQYSHFFESIINRINFLTSEGSKESGPQGLEFYSIKKDKFSRFSDHRQSPDFFNQGRKFFSLQVIVDSDEDNKPSFVVYCEDVEFSSLEHGSRLFEMVVRYILEKRPSGDPYPIYITDISMATGLLGKDGVEKVQAVQFLQYKERIEERLNKVLDKLVAS